MSISRHLLHVARRAWPAHQTCAGHRQPPFRPNTSISRGPFGTGKTDRKEGEGGLAASDPITRLPEGRVAAHKSGPVSSKCLKPKQISTSNPRIHTILGSNRWIAAPYLRLNPVSSVISRHEVFGGHSMPLALEHELGKLGESAARRAQATQSYARFKFSLDWFRVRIHFPGTLSTKCLK